MEFTKETITWILISIGTNLSAVILAILSWVRAAKMIPKELKSSDLDNKSKEISIAEQYDDLATRAAQKVLDMQTKLDEIDKNYKELRTSYESLSLSYEKLSIKISEQDLIIGKQTETIRLQTVRLNEQEEEIGILKFDLNLAQEYNTTLISEMRLKNLIPPEAPKKSRKKSDKVSQE